MVIPPKTREVARLYNGIQVRSSFEGEPGRQASLERETAASYALDLQFSIKVPVAARTAAEITHSAPTLLAALPKLTALLDKAEVSKFYYGIYQNKTELLRQNLAHLDALLPRDIFYDTDTVLEIQDPDSKRKFLLIQSDMDVDSDGSDPDRLNEVDTTDPTFQPLTSYKWPKRGPVPNPLLKPYHDRLDRLEADLKANPAHRNTALAIEAQRNVINQIEHYGSLIARDRSLRCAARFHDPAARAPIPAQARGLRGGRGRRQSVPGDLRRHRAPATSSGKPARASPKRSIRAPLPSAARSTT